MTVNSPQDFDYLEIGLASPDKIRFWSFGEVEKPETINYRTFKPERKGLFCEKIFGPVKDWECSCGKYRRVRYRGIVCERCGVEVTHSKVRRERMGHLELASDVSHIWFLKGIPSYMGLIMDMSARQLEEVIYYDSYIVTETSDEVADILPLKKLLSTSDYYDLKQAHGDKFKAEMGASAVKKILSEIDLVAMIAELRQQLSEVKGQRRLKIAKRLRIFEALQKSNNRPEWMILEAIPVMPPDLRPMVQLEGGRFATSDLNDLYRRVVNRNNRLKRLMDIGAPEMIIRNERRMLQEAVDVLISNGKRGRSVTGSNGRPLKSLGNIIEGKQGRFRQNLLGKRVDYSGRSVIVVGPSLKFHQCGLPKGMALELFKPFVIRKLVEKGFVTNVKSAKRRIEKKDVVVWDVLESIIKGQPVLLNRAPTLHRLGIQAFEPVLVEGSAIQIHPLVCTAFNADFDGDQMAVHVPLSIEAQTECRLLIMSSNNILSPSSGKAIITPTQDMILGCYFLTIIGDKDDKDGAMKSFANADEALRAREGRFIGLQDPILCKIDNERVETTVGRIIFNQAIWDVFDEFEVKREPFVNQIVSKKQLGDMVFNWFTTYGNDITTRLADILKRLGFKYSTLSGISISISDLKIPQTKPGILEKAQNQVQRLRKLFQDGAISDEERRLRGHDIWREATQQVSNALEAELGRLNNVYMMAHSGARGNIDQVRQLAGMRGLMSDSQGRTVNIPIKTNFKEGLSLTEYFISSYGARKGLVDTALRTADSGYLTRRLVDVVQDVMITEEDCGVDHGIIVNSIKEGFVEVVPISHLLEGRFVAETVKHPETGKEIVKKGKLLTEALSKDIEASGVDGVEIYSVYSCKSDRGICQKCYGVDLASRQIINIGEAVGIIAAQSIGEPGTQLTMRTFHTGGVDLRKASKVEIKAGTAGKVDIPDDLAENSSRITDENGQTIWVATKESHIYIEESKENKVAVRVPLGCTILVAKGDKVAAGTPVAEYEGSLEHVISENAGIVKMLGLKLEERKDNGKVIESIAKSEGEIFVFNPDEKDVYTVGKDEAKKLKTGQRIKADHNLGKGVELKAGGIVLAAKEDKGKDGTYTVEIARGEAYPVLAGARVYVHESDKIKAGEIIARERAIAADVSKTKDIVQGLPRVEELFEARRPKSPAILSEYDGVIEISSIDGQRVITVISEDGKRHEYKVLPGTRLRVFSGKNVKKGDQLSDGVVSPHDILATKGVFSTQKYLAEEILSVYTSQGVQINIKHIEVIVRQMTRKVNITQMGESTFLPNEFVDIRTLEKVNEKLKAAGQGIAKGERVLLGITRASLNTESFVSASSFQQTASVLTKAAIEGQTDPMYGLKENVIIGKLIPAGTGRKEYGNVSIESTGGEDLSVPVEEEVAS